MHKSFRSALFASFLLLVIGYTFSSLYHQKGSGTASGLAENYIGDHGLEIAGSGAVIIAKSGSTVVLYKNAELVNGVFSRLFTQVDFAFNFDDHFAMSYGSSEIFPIVWDSRTIARAGSLILAGGNARVLAEDGAKIISKNVDAPKWLWHSEDARVIYARAQHETD